MLINGAAGGVGVYLVQLAILAGAHLTAATSYKDDNGTCLHELDVDQAIKCSELQDSKYKGSYDVLTDSIGRQELGNSRFTVKDPGTLTS